MNLEDLKSKRTSSEQIEQQLESQGILELMKKQKESAIDFLKEMKPEIDNNTYDIVISDEGSARVITLLLGKTIQEIQKNRGKKPPKILFIDPSYIMNSLSSFGERDYKKYVKHNQKSIKSVFQKGGYKHALLVTELISSGDHVNELSYFLHQQGVGSIDLACQHKYPDVHLGLSAPKQGWENLFTDINPDGQLYGINKMFNSTSTRYNTVSGMHKVSGVDNLRRVSSEEVKSTRPYIAHLSSELAKDYLNDNL